VNSTEDDDRHWFLQKLKQQLKESAEDDRLTVLANTVGDRRHRDLSDIVFQLESSLDWNETVHYLSKVGNLQYSVPVGLGINTIPIEPLKYREVIFSLFSCRGLEAIKISTKEFLEAAGEGSSYVEAIKTSSELATAQARDQIESGDTLFFDIDEMAELDNHSLQSLLESKNNEILKHTIIQEQGDKYYIGSLWGSGFGLRALLEVGVSGFTANEANFATVLSVLQSMTGITLPVRKDDSIKPTEPASPINDTYKTLIRGIIHQDIDTLMTLGSRHAIPLANNLLSQAITRYLNTESSHDFGVLIKLIRLHIAIRSLESIASLEELANSSVQRVSTTAMVALANFYHESAVYSLAHLLCKSKDEQVIQLANNGLINIGKKLPEILPTLKSIESACSTNPQRIGKIIKRIRSSDRQY
jgi:HEAT repeat protein